MNINMLRDADNDVNIYAAACNADPDGTWRGATVYISRDGGTSYSSAGTFAGETTMGEATTALGNFYGGNIVDEINSVTVSMVHGTLSSTTNSGILEGVNLCVIGDEILSFRDATLVAADTYKLTGLLRGRRGSEYAMASHAVGDRFVLVDETTMLRVAQTTGDIGIERNYKPVMGGASLAAVTAQQFTNEGTGLKPYAPVHLGGGRNAAGDVTLTWVRRNRIDGAWRDLVDVPNSEASESYEVEIYDAAYATLKRTITGLSSPTTTYSAADQTTDFGAPQSTVYFKVYQLSAVVGRGHAASGSI